MSGSCVTISDGDALVAIERRTSSSMISALVVAVEIAGRLVREQHGGSRDDRAGDRHALLLAAGELSGRVILPALESPTCASAARRACALGGGSPR